MDDIITVFDNGFSEEYLPHYEVVIENKNYFQANSPAEIGKKLARFISKLSAENLSQLRQYFFKDDQHPDEQSWFSYRQIIDGFNSEKGVDDNAKIQEKADA